MADLSSKYQKLATEYAKVRYRCELIHVVFGVFLIFLDKCMANILMKGVDNGFAYDRQNAVY